MTPAEAAALLTIAAAYDNRKPDADQARAWAAVLDDLRFIDCREAVVAHFKVSRDWMMPVDVRQAVKKLRDGRITAYGPIKPPAHIDPDDTAALLRYEVDKRRQIADGEVTNPAPELESAPLDREAAKSRVAELRAEVAKRKPDDTEPPELAEAREAFAAMPTEVAAARAQLRQATTTEETDHV